jgi:Domain of unknown function (DUF222)/HNH endonuclease
MLSTQARRTRLDELFRVKAATEGEIAELLCEEERTESYRDEGATSTETWVVERYGVATATARALTHVGMTTPRMPKLAGALRSGEISFDKVRAVADVATPRTDRELLDQARRCSVRQLADVVRMERERTARPETRSEHERRFLRFNDPCRTMTVQLSAEDYASLRAYVDACARDIPDDGETPLDQRRCDGFVQNMGSGTSATSGSPYFVVAHVPLAALVDETGTTDLAGELERDGLIDGETVRRIACDATIAVAVDDDVGHTMYEGRNRRFPTDAQRREIMRRDRHCRFPGCTNVTFTNVHHIVPWKLGGRTDLPTLVLLCRHHHQGVMHRKGWSMSGNANEELTFIGPSGRVMTSRPSLRWGAVTAPRRG